MSPRAILGDVFAVGRIPGPAALVLAAAATAACGLLPAPEQPANRVVVGPWVAFARAQPDPSPELAAFLEARGVALRALADHRALMLTEPTDAALVPALLRIDDVGGARVYAVSGVPEPPDAWVLTFRAPAAEGGSPTEALVVVDAESGEVLLVHAELRGDEP